MGIFYFGYGANRDPRMIAAILGKPVSKLEGIPAVLEGYELAVQRLDQVPKAIRKRLSKSWDNNFKSYVILPNPDGHVEGTIWKLTPSERERIRDWELIDLGWYEDCEAKAKTADGREVLVVTEKLSKGQPVDYTVRGLDYPTWINPPEEFESVARKNRLEYDNRSKTKKEN